MPEVLGRPGDQGEVPDRSSIQRGRGFQDGEKSKRKAAQKALDVTGSCRLELVVFVKGVKYVYKLAKPQPHLPVWSLTKEDGSVETVSCAIGEWSCTCKDFKYRRRHCKHIGPTISLREAWLLA